jgi:regulatory protein
MRAVHEEIDDLLSDAKEDRFSSPVEARKKAMDFLARREYGQQELIDKLSGRGFDRDIAGQVVLALTNDGLQSDQRFAESFAQSRINRGKGPVRIRQELLQRGISAGAIEAAIEQAGADWHALAREIRQKKFGRRRAADFKEKARQMRFLQYRGFEPDQIQSAFAPDNKQVDN